MIVCYFGTYREEYSRNQIMIEGLRRNGVTVLECHERLWLGIEDRVQAVQGNWLRPAFIWRAISTYTRLLWRYRKIADYDILVVGYPGQFDVFLARLLSWLRGKPLVWDVFMSIYLIALERGLEQKNRLTVKLVRWVEKSGLKLPDRLIQDTYDYVQWLSSTHDISPNRFRLVPTGADDRRFVPASGGLATNRNGFRVTYYGTYIPNHGVRDIIAAAQRLSTHPDISFELIGDGPERPAARALVEETGLTNVQFIEWLDQEALIERLYESDLCLGAFGDTPQSLMTIQNKIFEGLALAKPVLSGDSPAVRRQLTHREHIYLCERDNPAALAEAILDLRSDPGLRQRLSQQGHARFLEGFSILMIGRQYRQHLSEIMEQRR